MMLSVVEGVLIPQRHSNPKNVQVLGSGQDRADLTDLEAPRFISHVGVIGG